MIWHQDIKNHYIVKCIYKCVDKEHSDRERAERSPHQSGAALAFSSQKTGVKTPLYCLKCEWGGGGILLAVYDGAHLHFRGHKKKKLQICILQPAFCSRS